MAGESSSLELQESGWKELRKEAKKIERDLDVKLSAYGKPGSRFSTSPSSSSSNSSGFGDAGSPTVGPGRSCKTTEMEIQSLLEKLLDINEAMSRCAVAVAPMTSVSQKLARHREILHEFTQEFRRATGNLNSTMEHSDLLSSVREDISECKASENLTSGSSFLGERAAIHGSLSQASGNVVSGANFLRERAAIHGSSNQKVYPQPVDETMNRNHDSMDVIVSKLFNTISSLKIAYMQLQSAHTPYDPDKIQIADKLVIEELMKLSELKHSYREKNPKPAPSSPHDARLAVEIQEQQSLLKTYEVMVKKFQSQIHISDSEILQLQKQITEAQQKKIKLEKKIKQRELLARDSEGTEEEQGFFSVELTPSLYSSAVQTVHKAIHDFSKALISMMKAAGWDLDAAADPIEPEVVYAKRAHKKFAFESHICQRMFSGFQEENFLVEPGAQTKSETFFHQFLAIRSLDPLEMLSQNPDSDFGKFCRSKYLLIIHPKMEMSFFGNLDHSTHVMNGGHPRTPFYLTFLKVAKSVWLLHRLTYSFDPVVRVFQVKPGTEFSEVYMESVVKNVELVEGDKKPKIGLMIMPGFMIGGTVIQSQVYLSGVKCAE